VAVKEQEYQKLLSELKKKIEEHNADGSIHREMGRLGLVSKIIKKHQKKSK
jgi:hypothetical protein